MIFLVKFDLEFDLIFEISDGKNLVKFVGRTFLPARKAREISGRVSGQISEQISEKILETPFQISRLFSEASFSLEKVQGATRLGATGLRASEREICLCRGSLRGPLKTSKKPLNTSKKTLKTSENLGKPLKTSEKPSEKPLKISLSETLSETLSGAGLSLRGSRSCCPYRVAP